MIKCQKFQIFRLSTVIELTVISRYERTERIGERPHLSRVGVESAAAVHAAALPGSAVQIWRTPPSNTRTRTHLPGNSQSTKKMNKLVKIMPIPNNRIQFVDLHKLVGIRAVINVLINN